VGKTAKPNHEFLITKEDQKMKTQKLFVIGAIVCLTVSVFFLTTDAVAGDKGEKAARHVGLDLNSLVSQAMSRSLAKAEVVGQDDLDLDFLECFRLSTEIFDIQADICTALDDEINLYCLVEAELNLVQNTIKCTFID
jgi:hypothetical protein